MNILLTRPESVEFNGRRSYHDPIRNKHVPATPEEEVRQGVIQYVLDELHWPRELILVEYPLSRHGKGQTRADVVLFIPPPEGVDVPEKVARHIKALPYCVIECKQLSSDHPLTDNVLHQAVRYAQKLAAKYVVTTNGAELQAFEHRDGMAVRVERPPLFDESRHGGHVRLARVSPAPMLERPRPKEALDDGATLARVWEETRQKNFVSRHTPAALRRTALELLFLLTDPTEEATPGLPWEGHGVRFLEDWGPSIRHFGHGAGSDLWGVFRIFLVEDLESGRQTRLAFTMFDMGDYVNDPRYGNRKGKTVLSVGTEDEERSLVSLELSLDKFLAVRGGRGHISHDGTITARVRLPNRVMLDHAADRAPELCDGLGVDLGEIPADRVLSWEDVRGFLLRLTRYALLRNEVREKKRKGLL